jgi:hypothetical protein
VVGCEAEDGDEKTVLHLRRCILGKNGGIGIETDIEHAYLDTILLVFVNVLCSIGCDTTKSRLNLHPWIIAWIRMSFIALIEIHAISGRLILYYILHATAGTSAEFLASGSASSLNNVKTAKPRSATPDSYI